MFKNLAFLLPRFKFAT